MLKIIKSSYFIPILFSYVYEKQKLKVIKYNKILQKDLNISILNYKYFTGRYIQYESNRIGKEINYVDNALRFEGEYLNGKRHGKGKEYNEYGNLTFEGEYLNGKRNGKGKKYNAYGDLTFEGEYLNGKRHGKGREFYCGGVLVFKSTGKLAFEGEYFNDKKLNGIGYDKEGNILYNLNNNINGEGKEYSDDKLIFEGEYLNGKRNGKGKEYALNGNLKFEGEYLNDLKWNGQGYDSDSLNDIEFGEFKNGKGLIKEYNIYGKLIFEGEYSNEQKNGKGKEYCNGKLVFEGEYLNDKRN